MVKNICQNLCDNDLRYKVLPNQRENLTKTINTNENTILSTQTDNLNNIGEYKENIIDSNLDSFATFNSQIGLENSEEEIDIDLEYLEKAYQCSCEIQEQQNKLNNRKITIEQSKLANSDYSLQNLPDEEVFDCSPRKLWGNILLKLRQNNMMTLHSACAEVRDLKFEDKILLGAVRDSFTYKILTKQENFDKILLELKQINDKIELRFVLKKINQNKIDKNIAILRKLFKDEIDII